MELDESKRPHKYPKLVVERGESPPQYPDYDEDTGEPSWDPQSHWG